LPSGSYIDPQTHVLALHGVLIPHSSQPVVFSLPSSPFKTHSNDFLSPYPHRPIRVVKLTFTYNWNSHVDSNKATVNNNDVNPTKANSRHTFSFSFANFGSSSIDNSDTNKSSTTTTTTTTVDTNTANDNILAANCNNSANFTKPYVGVLGHWIGVSDLLQTQSPPDNPNPTTTTITTPVATEPNNNHSISPTEDFKVWWSSSFSQISENALNNLCVSRAVDGIYIV
jgi:hypothetical protein